jgi:hypothetical protein
MEYRTPKLTFERIKTNTVKIRTNLVTIKNMARPNEDQPVNWKAPEAFNDLVDQVLLMRKQGKPVIWSMGAHVIKNGLSRYIIELVKEGIITHVAGNGATSIHDFELAFMGETSEDVAKSIEDGSFGMWEETGRYMNEAIGQGVTKGLGYGESLFDYLSAHPERFPHYDDCVFVQCQRYGVPYTCHISIGTDIIHQHPIVDFEALGTASGRDFETMCRSVSQMNEGGVFLNFGSAISGPEIFLKALSLSRNVGLQMNNITAANFDIVPVSGSVIPADSDPDYYYRPRRIFIDQLSEIGGAGYLFHGLHQATIPYFFQEIRKRKRELGMDLSLNKMLNNGNLINLRSVQLFPVQERSSKLRVAAIQLPEQREIPEWTSEGFDDFVTRWKQAISQSKQVLVSLGGHVVGSGVTSYLIDLIRKGAITHLAVNGAALFQDLELAAFGHTEEIEDGSLATGRRGMWQEPGQMIHRALAEGRRLGLGYGESVIQYASQHLEDFPYLSLSLMGGCMAAGIPYTCHITIGTDDIQLHPDSNFADQGLASGLDFQAYCHRVANLEGGVFINFGSTVTGPEVFLKALSIARNLGNPVQQITTANFDIVRLGNYHKKVGYEDWDYYYRPRKNIIHRPTSLGGKGYHFEGLHQVTIPVIWKKLSYAIRRLC